MVRAISRQSLNKMKKSSTFLTKRIQSSFLPVSFYQILSHHSLFWRSMEINSSVKRVKSPVCWLRGDCPLVSSRNPSRYHSSGQWKADIYAVNDGWRTASPFKYIILSRSVSSTRWIFQPFLDSFHCFSLRYAQRVSVTVSLYSFNWVSILRQTFSKETSL